MAVLVNDKMRLDPPAMAKLAGRTARLLEGRGAELGAAAPGAGDLTVEPGFLGAGYGHPTPEAEQALELARGRRGPGARARLHGEGAGGAAGPEPSGAFGEGPVLFLNTHGPREEAAA